MFKKKFRVYLLAAVLVLSSMFACFAQDAGLTAVSVFDELARQSGNQKALTRLITDNPESWYARWYMLSTAKRSIDITYFIVKDDIFGKSFLGLLIKKAKEGVKIRLMMDARGSVELTHKIMAQDFLQEVLETPGIEVKVYNPAASNLLKMFSKPANMVCSNHDKIIIVDNDWVMTGGRNIEMVYFADPADYGKAFRDTDVIFKGGSVARQIQAAFDEEYNSHAVYTVKKELFGNWVSRAKELEFTRRLMETYISGMGLLNTQGMGGYYEKHAKELAQYKNLQSYSGYLPLSGIHEFPVLILDKHSMKGTRNDVTPGLSALIRTAKSEIIIQNPYVVITKEAIEALKDANARGVKINIHTNSPMSDDGIAAPVFFSTEWAGILKDLPNCRLFVFPGPRPLHAKVFVFDREITVVGTYNMDPLSEQINSEVVAVIKGKTFALRTALRILEDEKGSLEYKIEVQKDGTVKILNGPENHTDPKKLEQIRKLRLLGFLRPLI